jgi:hypothetical protein
MTSPRIVLINVIKLIMIMLTYLYVIVACFLHGFQIPFTLPDVITFVVQNSLNTFCVQTFFFLTLLCIWLPHVGHQYYGNQAYLFVLSFFQSQTLGADVCATGDKNVFVERGAHILKVKYSRFCYTFRCCCNLVL